MGMMNAAFVRFFERYHLSPSVVFGQAFSTQQFALTSVAAVQIIRADNAKLYVLGTVDAAATVFIGDKNVTATTGFGIVPQVSPLIFAMAENAELWAIGSGNVTLFLIDMGL